jgi:KUP system potassium uptake protein
MVRNKEIDILSRYESLNRNNVIGDFKFVVIEKFLSNDNELPVLRKIILDIYFFIKEYSLSEEKAFGLDTSNVLVEKFPLVISQVRKVELKRVTE